MDKNAAERTEFQSTTGMSEVTGSTGAAAEPPRAGAAGAVIDTHGTVLGWTDAAEKLLGYTAADVVGRSVAFLLPWNADAALVEWKARARAREPWLGSAALRRKGRKSVAVTFEASPLSGGGRTDWFVAATVSSEAGQRDGLLTGLGVQHSLSAELLARSPVGLSIYDGDARCVWVNEETNRWDSLMNRQRVGRLLTELCPGPAGRALAAVVRRVFESGIPVVEREHRVTAPGEVEELVFSSTHFRLDGPEGQPLGVCEMVVDASQSRGRRHLMMLREASKRIGTTLDVGKTAQELAEVVVPQLADYVTVDLAEWVPLGDAPWPRPTSHAPVPGTPVFRRAGAASIHRGMPEALWEIGQAVFVPPSSPFTRALFSWKSHYEPVLDTSPGTWLDRDPDRARIIHATGMHSLIIVPLLARGTVLGEAVFVRTDNPLAFSKDELLVIEELTGRAALSLDNARHFTRERAASLALQRNLLPQHVSGGDAVDVASRYLPADTHEGVGGDWFDVIHLPRGRVGLVVGDVVGHGIKAAARMGQFRTVVRTLAELDLPPHELLSRLDQLVAHLGEQDSGEGNDIGFSAPIMGGTCVYAVYDPVTRQCTLARAGHPPPALVDPEGTVTFPDLPSGTPIGLGLMSYQSLTVELEEGTTIALYTDGLVETREADFDTRLGRLSAVLGRTGTTLEQLCTDVITAMTPNARRGEHVCADGVALPCTVAEGYGDSQDDVALLLARTRPLSRR